MSRVVPIVLAAGDSTRMGFPKALLPLGDGFFLDRILDVLAAARLAEPIVVLGRDASLIRGRISKPAGIVVNPQPERGQISSLQLAIRNLPPECSGILVWPVDQPLVSQSLVESLVRTFEAGGALLVMPVCDGRRGHPAVFHASLFAELQGAGPGQGPKEVVRRHEADLALIPTEERAATEDVDTPEDYLRVAGESLETALGRADYRRGIDSPG